jgi:hypothetical protein
MMSWKLCVSVALTTILTACSGGGAGNTVGASSNPTNTGEASNGNEGTGAPTNLAVESYQLAGQAQKGPFIFGANIWASELSPSLNPTGKTYITQTLDDLGNFKISTHVTSNLVSLLGEGYYMDELTGAISTAPISLRAVADLKTSETPTINILTTLQTPRLLSLMQGGMTYVNANAQSQKEVLLAFGIDSAKVKLLSSLFAMKINGNQDQDAVLLATSAVLSKMASNNATANHSSSPAELSYLLSSIAADIKQNGTMTAPANIALRNNAATQIDLEAVRTNVQSFYANKGLAITAPTFEEWIDKDSSGILPRRIIPITGFNFSNIGSAEYRQVITSNSIKVAGVGANTYAAVSATLGAVIIKNGSPITGSYSQAVDGDTFALQASSLDFGQSIEKTLTVGSSSSTWSVKTRTPTIVYAIDSNNSSGASPTTAKMYAHPFIARSNAAVKYLAIGSRGPWSYSGPLTTSTPNTVSIYANDPNLDQPSTIISTSNFFGNYFSVSLIDQNGASHPPFTGTSVYFGSAGVKLNQGEKYWVVMTYPTASPNDNNSFTNSMTDYGKRLASTDGVTWFDWQGQVSGTYSTNALPLYMAD